METEKLSNLEKKYELPEGLLEKIIRIEEEHQYQLRARGVAADIEELICSELDDEEPDTKRRRSR